MQKVKTCSISSIIGHSINKCLVLQEEQMNMVEGFLGQLMRYDPYSNTCNLRLRDHPDLSYRGNRQLGFQQNQQTY